MSTVRATASSFATPRSSDQAVSKRRAMSLSEESVVSSGMTTELDSASATSDEPEPSKAAAAQGEDFLWMYTEEPHRSRRMAILKQHPEVSWLRRVASEPLHSYTCPTRI